jgi:hypothetical protein
MLDNALRNKGLEPNQRTRIENERDGAQWQVHQLESGDFDESGASNRANWFTISGPAIRKAQQRRCFQAYFEHRSPTMRGKSTPGQQGRMKGSHCGLRRGDAVVVTDGEHRGRRGLYCERRPEGRVLIDAERADTLREFLGVKAGHVQKIRKESRGE